mgnify:CR=1 FL=1
MNPIDVIAILDSTPAPRRPIPAKPDAATFLRACDSLGFQPPYSAVRRLSR